MRRQEKPIEAYSSHRVEASAGRTGHHHVKPGGTTVSEAVTKALRADLEGHIDIAYRSRIRDHFNMDVSTFLGVRIPVVRKIAAAHFHDVRDRSIEDILDLCEDLLTAGTYEYKVIAFDWSYRCRRRLAPEHFGVLHRWLAHYVNDWTDCDDFCTHTLGAFLVDHPSFLEKVKPWTASPNRWMRRASAVCLIYGLRRGKHLEPAFEVARALFQDEDDLVHKGCGWMLKDASKRYPDEVFDFVMAWRTSMPRTTLRTAVKLLDEDRKRTALSMPA